jgi:hypothetical protein
MEDVMHQTLEWDADALAVQRSLIRGLGVRLLPPGQNEGRFATMPAYGRYGSWDQCLHAFGVGVYLLSRFFETGRVTGRGRTLYPPAWYRVRHAFLIIAHTIAVRIMPLPDEKIADRVILPLMQGAINAEKAWCAATKQNPIMPGLFDDQERLNEGANLTDTYNRCWASISPGLVDYRLAPSLWDVI